MRILLAALHPPGGKLRYGGVQSWISTVARCLLLQGHSVTVWGPEWPAPEGVFDLGIFAHGQKTIGATRLCAKVVSISHGIVEDEKPSGPGFKVFTSEEVRDHWKIDGPVLRQPIDLDYWKPIKTAKREKLIFYSYRAKGVFALDDLARRLGLEFVWLRDVAAQEARSVLQSAALVCASGRAALEAMACDAPTMICDGRDYNGGPLIDPSTEAARKANYSGRGGLRPDKVDIDQIARETMAFQRPRAYVEAFHDARRVTCELMRICSQL